MKVLKLLSVFTMFFCSLQINAEEHPRHINKELDVKAVLNSLVEESLNKQNDQRESKLLEQKISEKCSEIYNSDNYVRVDSDFAVRFVIFNFIESTYSYYLDQLAIKDNIRKMYAFVQKGSPAIEKLNKLVFSRVESKSFHLQDVTVKNIKVISREKEQYEVTISVIGKDLKDSLEYFDMAKLKPIDLVLSIELDKKIIFNNINYNIKENSKKSDIISIDLKDSINPFDLVVKDFNVISK